MRSILTLTVAALALGAVGQGPIALSLQQAQDLAAKQSYMVLTSELGTRIAHHRNKEITAIGLPQINGEVKLTDLIDVPTQLIPNFFAEPGSGGPPYVPVQFGVPWSASGGVTLTQLIFDGSYLVGLKAARELQTQSVQELERTQADARTQATKAYLGVLAAEEGVRLIGEGVPLLEKSLADVTAMMNAGFMENIDADRMTIQLEQALSQQRDFEAQAKVARMLLALTLGVPQGTPITLTERLDAIVNDPAETALSEQPLDAGTHVEMSYAGTLVRLQELNTRNEKTKALPNMVGFVSHQQQWNGPEFEPFNGPYDWYPSTLWGLTLNVPIFSSGSRHHKVQQAKLALEQVRVNQTATEQRLAAMAEQSRTQARSAFDAYRTEERNMGLSKNIFERTSTKFTNGMAASFELTQEQGNYLLAQQQYVQKLVELLMARADLRKALDLY